MCLKENILNRLYNLYNIISYASENKTCIVRTKSIMYVMCFGLYLKKILIMSKTFIHFAIWKPDTDNIEVQSSAQLCLWVECPS